MNLPLPTIVVLTMILLLSPPTQAGIQRIAQRIAEGIQREHQQENAQPGASTYQGAWAG